MSLDQKQTARLEQFSELCDKCGGLGEITRYFGGGKYESTIDCDQCRGRGLIGNCTHCSGTGLPDAKGKLECTECKGVGAVGDCTECGGTGMFSAETGGQCATCEGYGFLLQTSQ